MAAVISPQIAPIRPGPGAGRPHLVVLPGGRRALPPARVLRRRRAVALALVVVLGVVALCGLRLVLGTVAAPSRPPAAAGPIGASAGATTVVVQPGDTLWTIARRVRPAGDVRALVDRLVALNGSAVLQPGARVVLPG